MGVDYVSENGRAIFTADMITRGEEVFHLRGLMSSGSFLGDGSERGPDYTAEALHVMAVGIVQHYQSQMPKSATQFMLMAAEERMRIEVRNNTYDEKRDVIVMHAALPSRADPQLPGCRGSCGILLLGRLVVRRN